MEFKLPEIGEGVYEAELVNWLVRPGDAVKPGQNLMEVMTDKATMEVPSPFAGTIDKLAAETGQQLKVGAVVLSYTPFGEPGGAEKAPEETKGERRGEAAPSRSIERSTNGPALQVRASPSVRLLARKLGVDLAHIQGSGPDGRILVDDLSRAIPASGRAPSARAADAHAEYGIPGQRIKLQGVRRAIADHMVLSTSTIPHYSYVDECDVTELVRVRQACREAGERAGVKITYLPFFIKAAVEALQEVPIVNASLDKDAGEIVLHDRYHIGIAVATRFGLLVPVVRDADKKSLLEVAREIDRLSGAARQGKLKREELQGGTFTITSIGNIGGLFATPIIPIPQVAILGVGKIVKRPVFDSAGQVKPADMVYLSFSFDHRVLDGAIGAGFGNAIIRQLQNPVTMLVNDALNPFNRAPAASTS